VKFHQITFFKAELGSISDRTPIPVSANAILTKSSIKLNLSGNILEYPLNFNPAEFLFGDKLLCIYYPESDSFKPYIIPEIKAENSTNPTIKNAIAIYAQSLQNSIEKASEIRKKLEGGIITAMEAAEAIKKIPQALSAGRLEKYYKVPSVNATIPVTSIGDSPIAKISILPDPAANKLRSTSGKGKKGNENGRKIYALVDTGAQISLLDSDLARELGIARGAGAEQINYIGVNGDAATAVFAPAILRIKKKKELKTKMAIVPLKSKSHGKFNAILSNQVYTAAKRKLGVDLLK